MSWRSTSMQTVSSTVEAAVWCGVLAWFGQTAITPEMLRDPAGMAAALKAKSHMIVAAVLVLTALYVLVLRLTARPPGDAGSIETRL